MGLNSNVYNLFMEDRIDHITELSDPTMPILYTGNILQQYTSHLQTWCVMATHSGECLFINNQLQSNIEDEAIYHEYMVHSLLSGIKKPKNVLILGGSEGCVTREVLKWSSIEKVTMVDWDKTLCEYFMNEGRHWNNGSYEDKRVNVIYMDALEYVFSCKEKYDAIYIDLLDPVNGNMSYLTDVINYAKQIIGNRQVGGARQFLPVKVNSAGVMPIIFAQAIMFLPTLVSFTNLDSAKGFVRMFSDHSNPWYMVIYSVMVVGFTFLYTALIFNPKQIAEDLKRNNGFVPGVKPGEPTADYIGAIMDKITLPGAIFLAIVGIMPGFAQRLGVTQSFSTFFGGTSLLIMVGVVLDTLQQIETYLLMRQYDGLMSSGRVQGRQQSISTPTSTL